MPDLEDAGTPKEPRALTPAEATRLDQLERRRAAIDQSMWQAPALTIAAQAFLLGVLTDPEVATWTRRFVLAAGVVAAAAAILSLARLRARELRYSAAIADLTDKADIPPATPFRLPRAEPPEGAPQPGWLDRAFRWVGDSNRFPAAYSVWILALALFILADFVAYACAG